MFWFQLSRREISIQQYDVDLAQVKQQYREAVEENGRLEARIQAFAINAQSEQDVLSSEVRMELICTFRVCVGWFGTCNQVLIHFYRSREEKMLSSG